MDPGYGLLDLSLDYEPFPQQLGVHWSDARVTAVVTGARAGKTKCGSFQVCDDAVLQPDYWPDDVDRGEPYVILVLARDYPMIRRVVMPAVLRAIPRELWIGEYHETAHRLRVRGKCYRGEGVGETHVYFLGGKFAEALQGLKVYRGWVDEFPTAKEAAYDEMLTRLSDRRGRLLLTGTPQGPNWAYKRVYQPWLDRSDPDLSFHTWRTADNPYYPRQELERLARVMPRRYYDRTFNASWNAFGGQVWEEFLREVHVRRRADYTFVLSGGRHLGDGGTIVPAEGVFAGVDWGFGLGHAGAIVVAVLSRKRWYLVEESVAEGVVVAGKGDSWVQRALALRARWGVQTWYCDPESPEALHHFRQAGLRVIPADKSPGSVLAGIQSVANLIHVDELSGEPGLVVTDACRATIDEVTFYHWRENARKEEPEKIMDNTCDALRYMIFTHERRGGWSREAGVDPGLVASHQRG